MRLGQTIVVRGADGATVTIARDPVRVSFRDGAGRTVLRQIGSGRSGPRNVEPTPHVQFGVQTPPPRTAYRPFGFLVGTQRIDQVEDGQWHATLRDVTEDGVIYGATRVRSARRAGRGVALVLASDDPAGRRIEVTIGPSKGGGFAVAARVTPGRGVATLADSFTSQQGESFHGFGGRHDYIDQRGRQLYGWLQQQNVGSGSARVLVPPADPRTDRHLFPNGSSAAYYAQDTFVSDRGYGFLLDGGRLSDWRLASDRRDAWQVEVGGPRLDYRVVPGSLRKAVAGISALNGRHQVPPRWAQGSLMVRSVNFPADNAAGYLSRVRDDIRQIERTGTPVQAYGIEGWEFLSRRQLRSVIADLGRLGIRPMLYFRLFVGADEIGTDDPADYAEALERGYVATRADGSPYVFTSNFFADAALIDFTDAAAVRWWKSRVRRALELGAAGFMQDFGEQAMVGMRFDNGTTGRRMHNRISVLAHRATRQVLDRWRQRTGEKVFFYTRAGYSGTPGATAFESANFAGDSTTDWSRASGLASLTTDMLNRAIAGNFGFSTDIGGYFDIPPFEPTSKQLFIRWAEWAALSPLFRLHGSVLAGTHMPWTFDAETVRIYSRLARLHLRARPYLRKLWKRGVRTGMPPTRPMWLAYPDDRRAERQDQQWMLGTKVLVAPVVSEDAKGRRVYFPAGCWKGAETGRRHEGPGYERVAAPLGSLPYFFRCGERPFRPPAGG